MRTTNKVSPRFILPIKGTFQQGLLTLGFNADPNQMTITRSGRSYACEVMVDGVQAHASATLQRLNKGRLEVALCIEQVGEIHPRDHIRMTH